MVRAPGIGQGVGGIGHGGGDRWKEPIVGVLNVVMALSVALYQHITAFHTVHLFLLF